MKTEVTLRRSVYGSLLEKENVSLSVSPFVGLIIGIGLGEPAVVRDVHEDIEKGIVYVWLTDLSAFVRSPKQEELHREIAERYLGKGWTYA